MKLLEAGTYYFGNWDYLEEELQNNWNDVAESLDSLICTVDCTDWLILEKQEASWQGCSRFCPIEIDQNFTVMFLRVFEEK
ncbi:MAG: hypothetical protein ACLRMZ_10980 [Blautia marasmi]